MKKLLVLLIFISTHLFASPKIEFTTNKTHGLLIFIDTLVDGTPNLQFLKKIYLESNFNNQRSSIEIKKFKNFEPVFDRYFLRYDIPDGRKKDVTVKSMLITQSIYAKNIVDYKSRIKGILTISEEKVFFEILKYFKPIYEN